VSPTNSPLFEVVPADEAGALATQRRERRDWKPVIEQLVAGETLFITDEHVTESDVKYLSLALARRGQGQKLRTERIQRGGKMGRLLVIADPNASASVPAVKV